MVLPVNASTKVDYAVSAFSFRDTGVSQFNFLSKPGRTVYSDTNSSAGGYRVTIPASAVSGYLVIAGYYPIISTNSGTNGNWFTPTNSYLVMYSYSILSSDPSGLFPTYADDGRSTFSGTPFDGIIYIPAHDDPLYLFVGSGSNATGTTNYGAMTTSNASIYFVPDSISDNSEVVGGLSEINVSIQNIINQITSSPELNADSEAMVEQMEQLQDRIDELTQQIEENTNRPPPEDLVPSIPPVMVSPSDPAAIDGRKAISDMLSSSFLTTFLLMVFSLAFLRYVLFGKSK